MSVLLGAVADDFTGATDLANTLVKAGMRVVQLIGVPRAEIDLAEADAVVVALKSRTSPVEDAVRESLEAMGWLRRCGARQLFFKYCSTFDSTPEGNIGPVVDAMMNALDAAFAVVCPAFPANGRTVYQGHLFVGDQLLSDSPMKDHPLTPMRDASLVRLMSQQSERRVGLVPYEVVASGVEATLAAFESHATSGVAYGVIDALSDEHLKTIGTAAAAHKLVTGGSGVAIGLPENFRRQGLLGPPASPRLPEATGRGAVLAGSCSQATRKQIAFVESDWPCRKIDVHRVAAGEPVVEDILAWARDQSPSKPVLIYGSADPDEVAATQARYGRERAGEIVEAALGRIAQGLVAQDTRRIIVAGGETSGAVVSALNVTGLKIGPEIDPGVPWTETLTRPRLALALKSGNFGTDDFFPKALGLLP